MRKVELPQPEGPDPSILDLRVAEITKVEPHPDAEKLYIEHLDDGSGTPRVIVSGLKGHYEPEELVGKRIILVSNLKPAKLRGVESQGMLLAAEKGDLCEVLEAPGAKPGDPVDIGEYKHSQKEISIDEFFKLKMVVKGGKVTCEGHPVTAKGSPITASKATDAKVS